MELLQSLCGGGSRRCVREAANHPLVFGRNADGAERRNGKLVGQQEIKSGLVFVGSVRRIYWRFTDNFSVLLAEGRIRILHSRAIPGNRPRRESVPSIPAGER